MEAWLIVSLVLGVIWLVVFVIGHGVFIWSHIDGYGPKFGDDEYKAFASVMSLLLVFVFFHWIIFVLSVPVFILFGIYQGLKFGKDYLRSKRGF